MRRPPPLAAGVMLLIALLAGACARTADPVQPAPSAAPDTGYAQKLAGAVTVDAMMAHLQKLQEIADANDNTRVIGSPGYEASVDYVVKALRDKGFDVQTPEFTARIFRSEPGSVVAGPAKYDAAALEFSIGTPPSGITAALVPARAGDAPGCVPADYDGLPVAGAVVLVDRGKCPFSDKMRAASARGAVALVVADNLDEEHMSGTLDEATNASIPVVSVSKADGAALRGHTGPVTVTVNAEVKDVKARNVIAQTTTGSNQDVVMAGAHLDSVLEGPGINDNGSGVAAVLETALQMGPAPQIRNAVRFAFWGAEEEGLIGSQKYVESLDLDQLRDIALYLNFDMVASPNPGYFTYDGDQSAPYGRDEAPPRVPEGSAGIERMLVAYLRSRDKTAQDTSFDGRSDYDGFTMAGIPSGGLFSGAEENKTQEQAGLWGGQADQPFDPNYHKPTDTIAAIDRDCLGIQGPGVAYAIGYYAADISGRNGVPPRDDRTRHVLTDS